MVSKTWCEGNNREKSRIKLLRIATIYKKQREEKLKPLKIMLLVLSSMLLLNGCSTSDEKASNVLEKEVGAEVVHDKITISPSKSYEECIELRPGMVIDYEFRSSDDVNFNIHYHSEDKIHYPVSEKGVRKGRGVIDPAKHDYYIEEQEFYCLMWDNVSYSRVNVSFKCILKKEQ